jgi:hypothetical protein
MRKLDEKDAEKISWVIVLVAIYVTIYMSFILMIIDNYLSK